MPRADFNAKHGPTMGAPSPVKPIQKSAKGSKTANSAASNTADKPTHPTASHRPASHRDLQRTEIVKLFRRGWTVDRIAVHMEMSPGQVQADWKAVVKEVIQVRDGEAKEKIAMLLEEYAEVKCEAWEAWERSKLDHTKKVTEVSSSSKKPLKRGEDSDSDEDGDADNQNGRGGNKFIKRVRHREGRLPASEYLKTILNCLAAETELQGLNPKKQLEVTGQYGWDALVQELKSEPRDIVEERLLTYKSSDVVNISQPQAVNQPVNAQNQPIDAEFTVKTPQNAPQGGQNVQQDSQNKPQQAPQAAQVNAEQAQDSESIQVPNWSAPQPTRYVVEDEQAQQAVEIGQSQQASQAVNSTGSKAVSNTGNDRQPQAQQAEQVGQASQAAQVQQAAQAVVSEHILPEKSAGVPVASKRPSKPRKKPVKKAQKPKKPRKK